MLAQGAHQERGLRLLKGVHVAISGAAGRMMAYWLGTLSSIPTAFYGTLLRIQTTPDELLTHAEFCEIFQPLDGGSIFVSNQESRRKFVRIGRGRATVIGYDLSAIPYEWGEGGRKV